ncbi:MAG: hypothetical protein JWR90_718 [Marmoricola sp.]|jgi:hypothetical protein|nr:hypothetical protein [Marmoricola sp.]
MTQYPPPGADGMPPPDPPPGYWAAPAVPAAAGVPPWGPPVHQPGVVPLRPLTLGDIFGGAISTVRRNPQATLGLAAIVTFAFMVIPTVATVVLGASGDMASFDFTTDDSATVATGDAALVVATVVSGVFSLLSSIVVTGLIVGVVEGALVGRRATAGDAWRRSRGRLLQLLGLTLVVGLGVGLVFAVPIGLGVAAGLSAGSTALTVVLGLLGALVGVVGAAFVYTRFVLLSAPALVLEGHGVFASLRRAGQLAQGQFWRLLGTYLLASLATGLVSQVIAIPFAIAGAVAGFLLPSSWSLVGVLLTSNLSTVLTGALVGPFSAGIAALQYYDQRFRKEGLDIQLLQQTLQDGPR